MTEEQLKEMISDYYNGDEDMLNNIIIFSNPSYASAAIGMSDDDRVIYDYDLMVEHLIHEEKMSYEEAVEFIDYNTLRSLSYQQNPPIIKYNLMY